MPDDPTLGLMETQAKDELDLGVDVFKDAQGLTPVPVLIKQAERRGMFSQQRLPTFR